MKEEEECKDRIEEINVLMRPMIAELDRLRDLKRPITAQLRKLSRQREADAKVSQRLRRASEAIGVIHRVVDGMSIVEAKESLGINKRTPLNIQKVWFEQEYGSESVHSFGHPAWEARQYVDTYGIEAALQRFKPTLQYS